MNHRLDAHCGFVEALAIAAKAWTKVEITEVFFEIAPGAFTSGDLPADCCA
jgi:hypothetical protein